MVFVLAWFVINRYTPLAFDHSLDILHILLLTEGCCIGSIFIHNQYRQAALDRRITLSDYVVELRIQKQLKQLSPLIAELHSEMEKKKNFWCDGCGEPRYKCYCNEDCPHCGKKLVKCIGDSETGECPQKPVNNPV